MGDIIKKLIIGSSTGFIIIFIILLIPCLMVMNFFGTNITDNYIENNSDYASEYKKVLNNNISNGYVSLSRIIYLYLENENLTFDEIYKDNLDKDLKLQKKISDVCLEDKYKNLVVCKKSEIELSNQIDEDTYKPFIFPIDINKMKITSFFMEEREVFNTTDVHKAWDLSATNETDVYSVCDGEVVYVSFKYKKNKTNKKGAGGNEIKIKCDIDDNTSYIVWYAHLFPESAKVKIGDKVKQGDVIASVGTTGYSTGPHLHFQVQKDGTNVDGMSLIDFNNIKSNSDE